MQSYKQYRFSVFQIMFSGLKQKLQKKVSKKSLKSVRAPLIILMSVLCILFLSILLYNAKFAGRIFPNIKIANINLGNMTVEEAKDALSRNVSPTPSIKLIYSDKSFDLNFVDFAFTYNYEDSVYRAYNLPRTGNFFYDIAKRIQLLRKGADLGLTANLDEEKLAVKLKDISDKISVKPVYPSIAITKGEINIDSGKAGTTIDYITLRNLVGYHISVNNLENITIPLRPVDPSLNDEEIAFAKSRTEKYLGKTLILKFEYSDFIYKDADLVKFLNPRGGFEEDKIKEVIFKLAGTINRDPNDPKFQFDGNKVSEFLPATDGVKVDPNKLLTYMTTKLSSLENEDIKTSNLEIPVTRTKPSVSTQEVNNLGIKELIGRGTSTYFHSIPGRVFNVNLAASRINGILVKPGETFSFNSALGDVSKITGYKEAYVITGGKTVLGDGGGVCQVSTTLFRAALNAGLSIDERRSHAYRVGYYEQNSPPGMDATVYSPSTDFKFTNDTANHILIVAKNDAKNFSLIFELYGTNDGRVATLTKPVVSNYKPPLPTIYQDDPTLPAGTLKQVDYAAAGSRVTFNYKVTRNGSEIFQKTFISNYQPWAAIYLKGTKI